MQNAAIFFIQLQKGWMQSICNDKNRNSMEQADDKQADPMEAEKRETDLDEEQLLTREVAASGDELNSKNRGLNKGVDKSELQHSKTYVTLILTGTVEKGLVNLCPSFQVPISPVMWL